MTGKLEMLCDCVSILNSGNPSDGGYMLAEGALQNNGRIKFAGPFTECNRRNRNNRVYPDDVMRPQFEARMRQVSGTGLIGELDHPAEPIVHLERGSHRILRLWWDPKNPAVGHGEAVTTATPFGLVAEAYFHEQIPIGVSSRGVGAGRQSGDGSMIIQPGFKLVTWDLVADPSYQDGWTTAVKEIAESVLHACAVGRKSVSMSVPEANALRAEDSAVSGLLKALAEVARTL